MTMNTSQLVGKFLGTHHQVLKVLGEGAFSVVMKCHNVSTKKMEAVKIFKHDHNVAEVAEREVRILEELRRLDPDKCNIIRWNSAFSSQHLTWISFELLDQDLRSYLESKSGSTGMSGLQVSDARHILHQLTTALYYLKTVGIVHADLKPDNILCVDCNQQPLQVKLADFGLSQFLDRIDYGLPVQTMCYSAPEILVGSVYNEAIDMWSLGATAAELVLGTILYCVENEYDVLRAIIETQGQPPDYLLDQGRFSNYYFQKTRKSLPHWRLKRAEVFQQQTGQQPAKELYLCMESLDDILVIMEATHGPQQGQDLLVDLITKMLKLDPEERINPQEALKHEFFSEKIPPFTDIQQDIQVHQPSDFQHESQQDIKLENTGHFHKSIPNNFQAENYGRVQPDVAGYHQIMNCAYAQQNVPACGQYGSWIPVHHQMVNSVHAQQNVPACGQYGSWIPGSCQMFNSVHAQQNVPAYGQYGPWIPQYYQGNHQYPLNYAPRHDAYVHPGIPAHFPMANYMYVPGHYNMENCGEH